MGEFIYIIILFFILRLVVRSVKESKKKQDEKRGAPFAETRANRPAPARPNMQPPPVPRPGMSWPAPSPWPDARNYVPNQAPLPPSGSIDPNTFYGEGEPDRVVAQMPDHRHVEDVATETEGYAGEGDPTRYATREVDCETAGHVGPAPAPLFAALNANNVLQAVVFSEILGKPKALRR